MSSVTKSSVREIIDAKCLQLLIMKPFLGFIIKKMNIIEDKKSYIGPIPTAATDGKNIIYNEEFFANMKPQEVTFVLAHEVGHCILDTIGRLDGRDMGYWNMATDYIINGLLVAEKIGAMPTYSQQRVDALKEEFTKAGKTLPPEVQVGSQIGLHDMKYNGWTAEEVYADLLKNKAQKKQSMDVHLECKSSGSDGDDEKDGNSPGGSKMVLTKKEIEENSEALKDLIVESIQRTKAAGHEMGGIELMVNELLRPKINWRSLLVDSIQCLFKDDSTYTRPSRRNISPNVILPTRRLQETIEVGISIDTSGSISEEQRQIFLSEIAGILLYYKSFKLKIWTFDTVTWNPQDYDENNISELKNYKAMGGGGTTIGCNFTWMKEQNYKPSKFICLTDFYDGGGEPIDVSYVSTVFIIHSNPRPNPPEGCKWALYEELVDGR